MVVNSLVSLMSEVSKFRDKELVASLRETTRVLKAAVTEGYNHWIIAFSGGKDSSLVAVLVVELLRRQTIRNVQVDLVFSDTLMELPPFGENAVALIKHISEIGGKNTLPLRTRSAVAPIEHRCRLTAHRAAADRHRRVQFQNAASCQHIVQIVADLTVTSACMRDRTCSDNIFR